MRGDCDVIYTYIPKSNMRNNTKKKKKKKDSGDPKGNTRPNVPYSQEQRDIYTTRGDAIRHVSRPNWGTIQKNKIRPDTTNTIGKETCGGTDAAYSRAQRSTACDARGEMRQHICQERFAGQIPHISKKRCSSVAHTFREGRPLLKGLDLRKTGARTVYPPPTPSAIGRRCSTRTASSRWRRRWGGRGPTHDRTGTCPTKIFKEALRCYLRL